MEYLFIYLLQFADIIRGLAKLSMGLSILLFFVMTSFLFVEAEKDNNFVGTYFKIIISSIVLTCFLFLFPTKQTLLLIGGTYLGKKAVNAVITDEKIKKVDTIINLQLDKYIKELQAK